MTYETVIGLEVHAQLLTKSKMFCATSSAYADAPPNSLVCPVCLGMPGVLPVINRQAVEFTILTGLALGCRIPETAKFDRKNYPYPDLMKGYQISQYDQPFCLGGHLLVEVDGREKRIGITRIHLEEDTAKLVHRVDSSGESHTLVDVNRSGVPLMEIVSEPDMRSPEEARQYLRKLRLILRYLGVSTGNMEEGSFRCDANVSIRPIGATAFGQKVEVKNMNSFESVFKALQYEVIRQTEVIERGGVIQQETRGWDEARGITVGQRSKEHAHDYRYFPEPDLPPLTVSRDWVCGIQERMPELPDAKRDRYVSVLGLSPYQAGVIVENKATAAYFEAALEAGKGSAGRANTMANWLLNEVSRVVNQRNLDFDTLPVRPQMLAELLDLIDSGVLNDKIARQQVFERMVDGGASPAQIVREHGLAVIDDSDAITAAVDSAIAANPQAVEDFRSGKVAALTFLVGQVMKITRGKADPAATNQALRERLGSGS